jgi:protein-tyrosine phosphatase
MRNVSVLFVCLGNICRSPTAHGVFEQMVSEAGLQQYIIVDSCGTGDWHIGHSPDKRSASAALSRGYDLSHLRSRQINGNDFNQFDYILVMDQQNLIDVQAMCPSDFTGKLELFLDYANNFSATKEVPDPYYGGLSGFDDVIDLVEDASKTLLSTLQMAVSKNAQP